jgi:hypothetical protein
MLHIKTHDIEHMIERYEPIPELKKRKHMGIDGFARMMREELTLHTGAGPSSAIMAAGSAGGSNHHSKPDKLKDPLTYYFISASHNSYLEEGQVQGGCSVEAVSRALGAGVRWIEREWSRRGRGARLIASPYPTEPPPPPSRHLGRGGANDGVARTHQDHASRRQELPGDHQAQGL